jgi:riboflavin-specific deaminase-like protein
MHALLPHPEADVDVEGFILDERREAPAGRPWVFLNMVTSVDGATATSGRSGALGGPADRRVFHALRASADVVVAGAGTVRAEHYGPPRVTPELQQRRRERGQAELPRLAVVSGRLDLDLAGPFFTAADVPPLVITVEQAPADVLAKTRAVADVVTAGATRVDLGLALTRLHDLGARTVLVEGGPTLNGHLIAADLIDEVCLTLSPALVGGTSPRFALSDGLGGLLQLRLERMLVDGDHLFLRYLRTSGA